MWTSSLRTFLVRAYPLRAVERAVVWLVGSQRSGSTWLMNLLRIAPGVVTADEIGIGSHLGVFLTDVIGTPPPRSERAMERFWDAMRARDDYFFSDRFAFVWRPALRRLLLERFRAHLVRARTPVGVTRRRLVVKEPAGSQGADLALGVLPGSWLLVLLRDGRDVVDSMLDAMRPGGWLGETYGGGRTVTPEERLGFLEVQSYRWVARTKVVLDAYERHDARRRIVVRYEDLIRDTRQELERLFAWLGVSVGEDALRNGIERLSAERAPAEHRGPGRFVRAARPGLWRESLTPPERECVSAIMAPALRAAGYEV